MRQATVQGRDVVGRPINRRISRAGTAQHSTARLSEAGKGGQNVDVWRRVVRVEVAHARDLISHLEATIREEWHRQSGGSRLKVGGNSGQVLVSGVGGGEWRDVNGETGRSSEALGE